MWLPPVLPLFRLQRHRAGPEEFPSAPVLQPLPKNQVAEVFVCSRQNPPGIHASIQHSAIVNPGRSLGDKFDVVAVRAETVDNLLLDVLARRSSRRRLFHRVDDVGAQHRCGKADGRTHALFRQARMRLQYLVHRLPGGEFPENQFHGNPGSGHGRLTHHDFRISDDPRLSHMDSVYRHL
jgi:hypothetical protein